MSPNKTKQNKNKPQVPQVIVKKSNSTGDVTRDDSQRRRFLAQRSVAMLEQCCIHSKQCRNDVARL